MEIELVKNISLSRENENKREKNNILQPKNKKVQLEFCRSYFSYYFYCYKLLPENFALSS